jgi:hypothetical protein
MRITRVLLIQWLDAFRETTVNELYTTTKWFQLESTRLSHDRIRSIVARSFCRDLLKSLPDVISLKVSLSADVDIYYIKF